MTGQVSGVGWVGHFKVFVPQRIKSDFPFCPEAMVWTLLGDFPGVDLKKKEE